MQKKNPTVFVSYSWDNLTHQQWVLNLTNELRRKGIDATMDVFETQLETVNLNAMMISKIKNSDYIVIILTENYAQKADGLKGGVGFETLLTMPYLRDNLGKLILIMRHQGDYTKVFPFHYKDVYAIDMSGDRTQPDKLDELVYKIFNVPMYEMAELGPIPELKPKKGLGSSMPVDVANRLIPKLKKITDMDKNQFLKNVYHQLCKKLEEMFEQTKQANQEFDYSCEEITSRKTIFYAYVDGNKVTGIKIWYGSSMGFSEGIYFQFGSRISDNNDNSYNEMINCEVNSNNELQLKRSMYAFGSKDTNDIDTIIEEIWLYHIKSSLER
ncbi:hypothetical protein JCM17380_16900 [Desulfosporosinus burensis]